jgi:tRNA modification GTPase
MYIHDTIAAISTPIGEGGIGIIRVSGTNAHEIGLSLFRFAHGSDFRSHFLHYGHVVNPDRGEILDEVLMVLMKAPRSYTCEDLLEIHCHGGLYVTEKILATVLRSGARLAEPGEFTKRAFLNGRIDLLKAEAVIDVIASRSEASLLLARHQQEGELSQRIAGIRNYLVESLALLEAYIDFPDDDLGETDMSRIMQSINAARHEVSLLLASYSEGRIVRDGIKVLIVGKPNVGKSSLLNCLLGEERAIVTHIAGTTRDIIEETTSIDGLAIRLLDTAGIRETDDLVEQKGIGRALDCVPLADLILFVLDGSRPFSADDQLIHDSLSGKPVLLVQNKADLPEKLSLPDPIADLPLYRISTVTGEQVDLLKKSIRSTFMSETLLDSRQFVALSRSRHYDALASAETYLQRLVSGIESGRELETLTIDLRDALHAVGQVTGETSNDEILEHIFSSFCIGK